jgi:hypothetical protein
MSIIQTAELSDMVLHEELQIGPDYRIHSASNHGKAVVVKVFGGRHAKKVKKYIPSH